MERGRERSSTARVLELEREAREGLVVGKGGSEGSVGWLGFVEVVREVVVSPVLLRGGMVVKGSTLR